MKNQIRKRFAACLLCLACAVAAVAQNSIDQAVEKFSTLGAAKFTSVVDRDPRTRRVQKVVKVLELKGPQAGKLRAAFRAESGTGTFSRQQNDDEETLTLTCEQPRQVRIYMLRTTGHPVTTHARATIIVKMKD